MPKDMDEDRLCGIFAEGIRNNRDFAEFILSRTKFSYCVSSARLLHEEQVRARNVSPERWWRHWWWRVAPLKKDRETDIFLAFKDEESGLRFVLHIENKVRAAFTPGQAESYGEKAAWVAGYETQKQRMPHTEWQNILIAPASYMTSRQSLCASFDVSISHEDIAVFLPEFSVA